MTPGGVVTDYPLPMKKSAPVGIALGRDGNLWLTELTGDKIGRITTAGAITEFPIPTSVSSPAGITSDPMATCGSPS
jgi:virginiamycin B lyase